MKRLISLILLLSLFCLFQAGAQDALRLISGEGSDFSLFRDNVKLGFSLTQVDLDSFTLKEGDRLLTGEGTFLEFLTLTGGIRIMVGENSNLSFDSLNAEQGSLFTLSQGHIHGLLENNKSDLWISGSDTACRISQGEFGFILSKSVTLNQSEDKTRIYVLDGTAEVLQRKNEPGTDKRVDYKTPLTIGMGEMVVTSSWERDSPLIPSSFDADYSGFWKNHPFSLIQFTDLTPIPSSEKGEGSSPREPLITNINEGSKAGNEGLPINDNVQIDPARDKSQDTVIIGATTLALGTLFMSGAALSYMLGEDSLGTGLAFMGGINLLTGVYALAYTYFTPVGE